jgi:hypothetical protein
MGNSTIRRKAITVSHTVWCNTSRSFRANCNTSEGFPQIETQNYHILFVPPTFNIPRGIFWDIIDERLVDISYVSCIPFCFDFNSTITRVHNYFFGKSPTLNEIFVKLSEPALKPLST